MLPFYVPIFLYILGKKILKSNQNARKQFHMRLNEIACKRRNENATKVFLVELVHKSMHSMIV